MTQFFFTKPKWRTMKKHHVPINVAIDNISRSTTEVTQLRNSKKKARRFRSKLECEIKTDIKLFFLCSRQRPLVSYNIHGPFFTPYAFYPA